ncbi:uncharacterized protein KY384_006417 [Bacidia gigantensis]|uniref:uncharacterized protein n=1 Tax=Bacidia gigantensis TaxID=2732470 RepID=UPI001D0583B4|nr:uncharacterized protein KY384_006417 [Bacidia gigantensis]KAG8528730.1 hypothetical protein KY384_006417 [Bacidia gigantensis]
MAGQQSKTLEPTANNWIEKLKRSLARNAHVHHQQSRRKFNPNYNPATSGPLNLTGGEDESLPREKGPLQSGLVFNSACATVILGEPFTRWSLFGTILVCAGAVLIAIFGAIGEPAHNLDQLLALLQQA